MHQVSMLGSATLKEVSLWDQVTYQNSMIFKLTIRDTIIIGKIMIILNFAGMKSDYVIGNDWIFPSDTINTLKTVALI